VALWPY
jgi:uncharacterized membrane protein